MGTDTDCLLKRSKTSVPPIRRNLCALRDALKIISDRQKKDKEELLATIKQEVKTSANKDNGSLSDEVHKLKHDILEQLSKPQHRKVTT